MANIFDRKPEYDLLRPGVSRATYSRKHAHVVGLHGAGEVVRNSFRLAVSGSSVSFRDGRPIQETRGTADADRIVRPSSEFYLRRQNGDQVLASREVPQEYYQRLRTLGGDPAKAEVKFCRRGMTEVADVWLECPVNTALLRAAWPRVKGPLYRRLGHIAEGLWRQEWQADVRLLNAVLRRAGAPEIECPVAKLEGWCDIKISGHNNGEFLTRIRRDLPVAKAVALASACGAFAGVVTGVAIMGRTGESCIPHPPSSLGPLVPAPEGWKAVYSNDFGTLLVPPDGFLILRQHMSSAGSYLRERLADFYKANLKSGHAVYVWPSGGYLVHEAILFGWREGQFSRLATPGVEQLFQGANEVLAKLPMRQELLAGWTEACAWAAGVVAGALEEVAPTMNQPATEICTDACYR